eukprot:CAMPEP_0113953846 /NCGR_PEP_ID=MMETSP0011_2-20120614/81_1 /TAXON_ID=101924 /ORGANISM="Rhodosorus marinus" /LENGTH=54 /DNA_ID=CAMNT_0000962623 /DNA_START=780 /DNA_END=941 /DNA_ORIENTATION=- /assembly_acc=CAM_ASM_000156
MSRISTPKLLQTPGYFNRTCLQLSSSPSQALGDGIKADIGFGNTGAESDDEVMW